MCTDCASTPTDTDAAYPPLHKGWQLSKQLANIRPRNGTRDLAAQISRLTWGTMAFLYREQPLNCHKRSVLYSCFLVPIIDSCENYVCFIGFAGKIHLHGFYHALICTISCKVSLLAKWSFSYGAQVGFSHRSSQAVSCRAPWSATPTGAGG